MINIWDYGSTSALFNITQHQAAVKVGLRDNSAKGSGITSIKIWGGKEGGWARKNFRGEGEKR